MTRRRKQASKRARSGGEAGPQTPELVGRAEAAAALGVAPGRISKWVADGAPVARRGARGQASLYDVAALKRWRAHRTKEVEAGLSLEEERAKLARVQRQKAEMEIAKRTGELLERSEVIAEGQAALSALKAALLRLPRELVMSGLIPRETEPAVRDLITDALRELARWRTVADGNHVEPAA